jgi:hypothetical protein
VLAGEERFKGVYIAGSLTVCAVEEKDGVCAAEDWDEAEVHFERVGLFGDGNMVSVIAALTRGVCDLLLVILHFESCAL